MLATKGSFERAAVAALGLLVGLGLLVALAQQSRAAGPPIELLFAQNAAEMRYEDGTLTLGGIAPATTYFADRPSRLVGTMSNQAFVDHWAKGKESFAADPPNAALSLLDEPGKAPIVVELIDVALNVNELVYKVRILEGDIPAQSGPVSLFIDPNSWGGTSLPPNVDPATDPELQPGSGFSPAWGPAFANASEPEDMRGPNPNYRCGTHTLLSFNICF